MPELEAFLNLNYTWYLDAQQLDNQRMRKIEKWACFDIILDNFLGQAILVTYRQNCLD